MIFTPEALSVLAEARDAEQRVIAATVILFTTPPSDRALKGWGLGEDWLGTELAALDLRERMA